MLEVDDDFNSMNKPLVYKREAPEGMVAHLQFQFVEKGFTMPDYLYCRMVGTVFSEKIYNVLKDFDIKDFQLVPAVIKGKKGEEYTGYYAANVYREYAFLDKEKSEYDRIDSDGRWDDIEKMVLDEAEMAKVPLAERLVFRSREWGTQTFWHKSIVDAIMAVEPTGIRFRPGPEWEE